MFKEYSGSERIFLAKEKKWLGAQNRKTTRSISERRQTRQKIYFIIYDGH